jgi:tetratricopeptide (TPR) repeat protein
MTENLASAIFYFTKATDCDPGYYQAYNNLGLAYETKGDIENAKKYYGKAIDANPEFQLAKDNLNNLQ